MLWQNVSTGLLKARGNHQKDGKQNRFKRAGVSLSGRLWHLGNFNPPVWVFLLPFKPISKSVHLFLHKVCWVCIFSLLSLPNHIAFNFVQSKELDTIVSDLQKEVTQLLGSNYTPIFQNVFFLALYTFLQPGPIPKIQDES